MSQYTLVGRRKRVDAALAKTWIKFPEDEITVFKFTDPRDIITLGDQTPAIAGYIDPTTRLASISKLAKTYGVSPSKHRPKIAVSGAYNYFSRCQLTGQIKPFSDLQYTRIYDRILLVSKALAGYVYLQDNKQWIRESDVTKHNVVRYYGTTVYYAKDADWIAEHIRVAFSEIENRLVLLAESKAVIISLDTDNRPDQTSLVSKYELARMEFNRYIRCAGCANHVTQAIFERGAGGACPTCAATARRPTPTRGEAVYSYNHRVERDLGFNADGCETVRLSKSKPTVPVYLGIEIEYNVADKHATASAEGINTTGYALCKFDRSIEAGGLGGGYEIVSQPCSIKRHKEQLALILSKYGKHFTAGPTCGIHVHISREPFDEADVGKMLAFLHRDANRDFIVGMARRESHKYARLTDGYIKQNKANPRDIKRGTKRTLLTNQDHGSPNRERYTALNVRDDTLEFRIFAGSTDLSVIIACLQFCEALGMYAKAHTTSSKISKLPLTKWTDVANFIEFLKDSKIKTLKEPAKDGKPPVYEVTQKYEELEMFIINNKLPTSSKNVEEVLYAKVKKSIVSNIHPVYRHREIPNRVADSMTKALLADRPAMLRWLLETSEGKGGLVKFNDVTNHWELVAKTKDVVYAYEDVKEKAA